MTTRTTRSKKARAARTSELTKEEYEEMEASRMARGWSESQWVAEAIREKLALRLAIRRLEKLPQ